MTGEEMEKTIEFLLNQQAEVTVKLDRLTEVQTKNTTDINQLVQSHAEMQNQIGQMRELMEAGWLETRAAMQTLMDSVENARDFAQQVARLAVSSERRLTNLEGRVDRIEGPQQ